MDGLKFDWEKAKFLIETSDGLKRVAAGLDGTDLSWGVIWENGSFVKPSKGIFASTFDLPLISLQFNSGKFIEKECWIEIDKVTLDEQKCPDSWGG